jgi:hypothetical protein
MAVNNAYAHNIKVFAPTLYAVSNNNFQISSIPIQFASVGWGIYGAGGSAATGSFNGNVGPGSPLGTSFVQFSTGPWIYTNNVTQPGSVTSAAYMNYSISPPTAKFTAKLFVTRTIIGTSWHLWQNFYHPTGTWQDGPGPISPPIVRAIDLEITPADKSIKNFWGLPAQPFMWIPNAIYRATFVVWADALSPNASAWFFGQFKHLTYVFLTSSPLEPMDPVNTTISLSPPVGPVGTNVQVGGTGFAPASPITVSYDNSSVTNTTSDGLGNFTASFNVPPSSTGPHFVAATDGVGNQADTFFNVYIPSAPLVGDLNNDGKIDIRDISIVARQFGKTDPNMASMGTTADTPFTAILGIAALATTGTVTPTAYALLRKRARTRKIDIRKIV